MNPFDDIGAEKSPHNVEEYSESGVVMENVESLQSAGISAVGQRLKCLESKIK